MSLLTAIEVLTHREFYDTTSEQYYAPYRADSAVIVSAYADFVHELVCDGTYSDMLTVLAVSSVVQKSIQTRWPVTVNASLFPSDCLFAFLRHCKQLLVFWLAFNITG